jgi:hypothetical protein
MDRTQRDTGGDSTVEELYITTAFASVHNDCLPSTAGLPPSVQGQGSQTF